MTLLIKANLRATRLSKSVSAASNYSQWAAADAGRKYRRTQMKKLYLITAILLLSAVWVAAQSTSSSPSSSQSTTPSTSSSPSTPSGQSTTPDTSTSTTQTTTTTSTTSSSDSSSSTIEGCLNGSAGNYTLTDNSGKTWQLAGDTSKLSDHVGHQVRLNGSQAGGSDTSANPSSASGNAGVSGSTPGGNASGSISSGAGAGANSSGSGTFTVTKVKMISSSCSTGK
jgi:cytoskeletal protein RodZ